MNPADLFLLDCPTYEDYLNSYSLSEDMRYLRNKKFCCMLVSLGYRSTNAVLTQEQFEAGKELAYESIYPTKKSSILFSHKMISKDPALRALADREKLNVQKIISTIIFIKIRLKSGFEVSGYIDFEESLRLATRKADYCVDWEKVFQEKIMLKPSPRNLSYYDWKRKLARYNNTENYIIVHDVNEGLLFMNRGDHKIISADSKNAKYSKNCTSSIYQSDIYGHVMLYDHPIRKKI